MQHNALSLSLFSKFKTDETENTYSYAGEEGENTTRESGRGYQHDYKEIRVRGRKKTKG